MKKNRLSAMVMCMAIGDSAFEGCTDMETVIFWGGETIGDAAFKNCSSLTDISIPSDVKEIGVSAFEGCTSLETVFIWGNDVTIGVNAFANCPKLEELPKGAVNIKSEASASNEEEKQESVVLIDGMRPDFKEAMDSYEAFYDEYCDFMKKYNENPGDFALIMEYADMLTRAAEMSEKFEEWNSDDLNDAEMKYYLEVHNRVSQKLIDVAY